MCRITRSGGRCNTAKVLTPNRFAVSAVVLSPSITWSDACLSAFVRFQMEGREVSPDTEEEEEEVAEEGGQGDSPDGAVGAGDTPWANSNSVFALMSAGEGLAPSILARNATLSIDGKVAMKEKRKKEKRDKKDKSEKKEKKVRLCSSHPPCVE